jgi:RNA polymerase sigma-70 factor (ECF subfamily)
MVSCSPEAIWERFHTPLTRFVRQRVSDSATADDLLQDVYVKIHIHLDTLRDDRRLQSWIYQIARNTLHDYYRKQPPLDLMDVEDIPTEETRSAEPELFDKTHERLATNLRTIIDQMPERYRQAVILAELEELPQREVARRLGLSVSGAKSRVQRGRLLLREMMLACCHLQFDHYGHVIDYTPRGHICRYESPEKVCMDE